MKIEISQRSILAGLILSGQYDSFTHLKNENGFKTRELNDNEKTEAIKKEVKTALMIADEIINQGEEKITDNPLYCKPNRDENTSVKPVK